MTTGLTELFSSSAKTEVLQILYDLEKPTALRQIAELSTTALCSVDLALKNLLEQGVVRVKRKTNRTLYSLDPSSELYPLLVSVCRAAEEASLSARALEYELRAAETLQFVSSSVEFLQNVRSRNK